METADSHEQKPPTERRVMVTDPDGAPLTGIEIARVSYNGTFLLGVTDADGSWIYDEPFPGTATLLAASEGRSGQAVVVQEEEWSSDPIGVALEPIADGGSVIFRQGTGHIPGLDGRLNPIRDSLSRHYIYGDNLSFEDQPDQPFRFTVEEPFSIADAKGNAFSVRVLAILGRTSLLEYRRVARTSLQDRGDA